MLFNYFIGTYYILILINNWDFKLLRPFKIWQHHRLDKYGDVVPWYKRLPWKMIEINKIGV